MGLERGQNYWTWLAGRPEEAATFNLEMNLASTGRKSWLDIYPFEGLIPDPKSSGEEVLLFDVGGNSGIDVVEFRKRFPQLKGRVVLR